MPASTTGADQGAEVGCTGGAPGGMQRHGRAGTSSGAMDGGPMGARDMQLGKTGTRQDGKLQGQVKTKTREPKRGTTVGSIKSGWLLC